MNVDTYQNTKKIEADSNMIFQMKQIDYLNKGHYDMAIPAVK